MTRTEQKTKEVLVHATESRKQSLRAHLNGWQRSLFGGRNGACRLSCGGKQQVPRP